MNIIGYTTDDLPVVDGVFFLVGTHGIPLEVVLDLLNRRGLQPCWLSYVRDAMKDGAKLRTVRARLDAAIGEVYGPDYLAEVNNRLDQLAS